MDGHDTLLATSEIKALSSPSADHSLDKSLTCSVRLDRLEERTGRHGGRKARPGGVSCDKGLVQHEDPTRREAVGVRPTH